MSKTEELKQIKNMICFNSQKIFNNNCEKYKIISQCNHKKITTIIFMKMKKIKTSSQNKEMFNCLDDAIQWIIKLHKKYKYQDIGNITEEICDELIKLLSFL